MRVNNCRQLIAEVGVEAVRRDNICKTQCSFALSTPPDAIVSNLPGVDSVLTAPLPPSPPQQLPQGPRSASAARPGSLPRAPSPPRPPLPVRSGAGSGGSTFNAATPVAASSAPFFTSPSATRSSGSGLQGVSGGSTGNQGAGTVATSGSGQVSLGNINQLPVVNNNINNNVAGAPAGRQPRPLFKMPSLRLPNLSDFFGL